MPHPDTAAAATACRIWWVAAVAAVVLLLPAVAYTQQPQQKPAPAAKTDTTVYTYVEQMPELTGGGGMPAVAAYFTHHFHLTVSEARAATGGSVAISFVVAANGDVSQGRIVRSGGAAMDAAALRTIRSLPHFHPGHQGGIPVRVKLVLPISCIKFQ